MDNIKEFRDSANKLTIKVWIGEEEKILVSQKVTLKLLREIDKIILNKDTSYTEKLYKQIVLIFGGNEKDYDELTLQQASDINNLVGEYIKNPTKVAGNRLENSLPKSEQDSA